MRVDIEGNQNHHYSNNKNLETRKRLLTIMSKQICNDCRTEKISYKNGKIILLPKKIIKEFREYSRESYSDQFDIFDYDELNDATELLLL